MITVITHYLHYLGFGLLMAALMVELFLYKTSVSGSTARKMASADAIYGFAAVLVLVTGLLNVFHFGKTPGYYGHNFIFHIKMTVYLVVFLISIYPTINFIKVRKTALDATANYPGLVGRLLWVEMVLLLVIPLLGVMMARGYGYTG